MKLLQTNGFFYFTVLLVVLSVLTPEAEGRRLVLRGRRTITRHYYRGLAIPAWAIVVLCALANLLIGGILYLVLYKLILSSGGDAAGKASELQPMSSTYAPAATMSVSNDV